MGNPRVSAHDADFSDTDYFEADLTWNGHEIANEKIHALHLKKSKICADFRSSFHNDFMLKFSVSKIKSRMNIPLQALHLCQLDKPRIGFYLHQEYHFIH